MHLKSRTVVLIAFLFCTQFALLMIGSDPIISHAERFELHDSPALAYIEHGPIHITSDADFIAQKELEGWLGNGTESSPIVIEDYNITYNGYSIFIANVSVYFEIRNCYFTTNLSAPKAGLYDDGVTLNNVSHGQILDNTFVDHNDGAIYMAFSHCSVRRNIIARNRLGVIYVNSSGDISSNEISYSGDGSLLVFNSTNCIIFNNHVSTIWGQDLLMQESSYCSISDNTFENNTVELRLTVNCNVGGNHFYNGSQLVLETCSYIVVEGNDIIAPANQGLLVSSSSYCSIISNDIQAQYRDAIHALSSLSCNYTANAISNCSVGILIDSEISSVFTYNHIMSQSNYGIMINSGSGNHLYGNLLVNEGLGFFSDDGFDNHWDDGYIIGNFLVGITEGPYLIDGSGGGIDYFARPTDSVEYSKPILYSSPTIRIIDETNSRLAWVVWRQPLIYGPIWFQVHSYLVAKNPVNWWFYEPEEIVQQGSWESSSSIQVNLSDLSAGYYNFTLMLNGGAGPMGVSWFPSACAFIWPNDPSFDMDFDGMSDTWEVNHFLNPRIDDSAFDPDSDNLTNLEEYRVGTDPHMSDSDEDFIPDGWEVLHGLNPLLNDAFEDPDFDNLINLREFEQGTNPFNSDSDLDSIFDGWEVWYGLDPLDDSDAALDFDNDSLTNLKEFELGTNPNKIDSDSDNFPDAWEVVFGFDPNNPAAPLVEYLIFYYPIIIGFSGILILGMNLFILQNKYRRLSLQQLVKKEKEEVDRALRNLLE